MDFERYYIDLFEMLNSSCKKIAYGKYDKKDVERLFSLSQTDRFPGLFTELAESFGMMMVKVEAREFRLKQIIEELEKTKAELEERISKQKEKTPNNSDNS
jgi:hypothetical protein